MFCFEICTPEGRGGERGGNANFKSKHTEPLVQEIPSALYSSFGVRVLYWLAILGVGGYFTLTGLLNVIQDYWRYPSVTSNELVTKTSVTFPAVTVCNLNRIHCMNLVEVRMSYDDNGKSDFYNISVKDLDHLIFNATKCKDQVSHRKMRAIGTGS